jgi:hypothetical protein
MWIYPWLIVSAVKQLYLPYSLIINQMIAILFKMAWTWQHGIMHFTKYSSTIIMFLYKVMCRIYCFYGIVRMSNVWTAARNVRWKDKNGKILQTHTMNWPHNQYKCTRLQKCWCSMNSASHWTATGYHPVSRWIWKSFAIRWSIISCLTIREKKILCATIF